MKDVRTALSLTSPGRPPIPPRLAVGAALGAVYLIWGSTYLAISVALEGLPPFLLGAVRFVLAGVILGLWPLLRHGLPTTRQLLGSAALGVLLVGGGNGAVNWASQWVASGTAALVSAITPCFIVALELLSGQSRRINGATAVGLGCGIAATFLLVDPFASSPGGPSPIAIAVLLFGALSWAAGTILSGSVDLPNSSALATGLQLVFGGLFLGVLALFAGEPARLDLARIHADALWAVAYLVLFGSVVGYGCYCWLLRVVPLSLVATHSYVNPLVAVGLGWLLAGEALSSSTLFAGGLTLCGVVLISRGGVSRAVQGPSPAHSGVPPEHHRADDVDFDSVAVDLLEPEWSLAAVARAAAVGTPRSAAILRSASTR